MITQIRLVNFRNFSNLVLSDIEERNFIVGENGQGKTNILEALSILCDNSLTGLALDNLVKQGEDSFFIEIIDSKLGVLSFSYEKETKKKKYLQNKSPITRKKFTQISHKCVCFSPIIMNLLYLSPGLRRDFLDGILSHSFPEYKTELGEYKKIVRHRNKVLKNIAEQKSSIDELGFWNTKFCDSAEFLYKYRFKIIEFFQKSIGHCSQFFGEKIQTIELVYDTKVQKETIREDIEAYLEKNTQRDIILAKTPIGPHVDDFDIFTDGINIVDFASRGETKSVIVRLKLMETVFVEKMTGKKPILLIDDLLSELDQQHEHMLLETMKYYQIFISSIEPVDENNNIII